MRLRSLSFRGITRFQSAQPVSIDFDELGPGIIALVGRNGEGKTTAMEATPAALFKSFPTRPNFYESFHGRDAFIEATFDDAGQELRVRVQVDAVKKTTEGYVFLDGTSLTTGRAAEFEGEISKRFGSYELFLSSVFACQTKAGSFLGMKKADRKDLFVELLGLGALQVLAESARERGVDCDRKLDTARTTLGNAEWETKDLDVAEVDLIAAQHEAEAAAKALDDARAEEGAAIQAHERAKSAGERIAALADAERSARASYVQAENVLAIASRGPKLAQDRRDERLSAIMARRADRLAGEATQRHAEAVKALETRREALRAQLKDVPDLAEEKGRLAELEAAQRRANDAIEEAAAAGRAAVSAGDRFNAATDRLAAAKDRVASDRARLTKQAERLAAVPCTGPVPDIAAACPLLADARTAREQLAAIAEPDESEMLMAKARYGEATNAAEALARKDQVSPSSFIQPIADARSAIAKAEAAVHARQALAAIEGERLGLDLRHDNDLVVAHGASLQAMKDREAVDAKYETELMEADEALGIARKAHADAGHNLEAATHLLHVAKADAGDVGAAEFVFIETRDKRQRAEIVLRRCDEMRATAHAKVEDLRARASRLPELQAAVQLAEQEVGDWTMLTKALGRDGVQALEIDAAGPEVATLTNDLLAACYGPRFSITFETLAVKRDGGSKEVFDIRVYDGAAERNVEALSGGERVVVGECLGLAISIFNARKSGISWGTIWRDETAGALDPENAQAYVRLLRRARELGPFTNVIFVAHQTEVTEAADMRLIVEGGRISIDRGRHAAAA